MQLKFISKLAKFYKPASSYLLSFDCDDIFYPNMAPYLELSDGCVKDLADVRA